MKFATKVAAALFGAAVIGFAFAPTEAQAGCGFGCGAAVGVVGGAILGAAAASAAPPPPRYVYVPDAYAAPGYVYYETRAYDACRKIFWRDEYGRRHSAWQCPRY